MDVAKQASVAIGGVELRIGFELHSLSGRREPLELDLGLTRMALALAEFGRIDLHQAHASTTAEVECVPVADSRDRRDCARRLGLHLRAAGKCEE